MKKAQEELSLGILDQRQRIATLSVDKIKEQRRALRDQRDVLAEQEVLGVYRAMVEGTVTGAQVHPALGVVTGALGFAGALANSSAQRDQLDHQLRMAEIEQKIAESEVAIAQAEIEISKHRIDFYEQKLAFLQNKRLNDDFLYMLAEISEKRAERLLEGAIFLAYLFERALAFFLGEPNIRHIQFDYLDRPGGIFDAAAALQDDFGDVQKEFAKIAQEKFCSGQQFFGHPHH